MADGEMAHRIAAVRLEPEAFRDLPSQQIAGDVFVACRDDHVARLERREPIRVDVGEHAGSGAELEECDILTLGDCARELRLHLHDVGFGEPSDQIDIVNRKVDDHPHVRHAWWERADTGDGDGKNVFVANSVLDRFHGRVEPLDMTHHQRHTGMPRCGDDRAPLFDRRRNRLLHQYMDAARDTTQRQFPM